MTHDPRVDAYIAAAAPFAQPILRHLRARVHAACPAATEAIKWGMPAFLIDGRMLCGMAAFKAHASFGFWQRSLVAETVPGAMGQFGRIATLADLPDDAALDALIAKAAALPARAEPRARAPRPMVETPPDLAARLAADSAAQAVWEAFPPGQRREYVDWIVDARRAETRARRLDQAIGWIAEGKRRNWKYEGC